MTVLLPHLFDWVKSWFSCMKCYDEPAFTAGQKAVNWSICMCPMKAVNLAERMVVKGLAWGLAWRQARRLLRCLAWWLYTWLIWSLFRNNSAGFIWWLGAVMRRIGLRADLKAELRASYGLEEGWPDGYDLSNVDWLADGSELNWENANYGCLVSRAGQNSSFMAAKRACLTALKLG